MVIDKNLVIPISLSILLIDSVPYRFLIASTLRVASTSKQHIKYMQINCVRN